MAPTTFRVGCRACSLSWRKTTDSGALSHSPTNRMDKPLIKDDVQELTIAPAQSGRGKIKTDAECLHSLSGNEVLHTLNPAARGFISLRGNIQLQTAYHKPAGN